MGGKENVPQTTNTGGEVCRVESAEDSRCSLDKEVGLPSCRVCQCAESDKRGDVALAYLGITLPVQKPEAEATPKSNGDTQQPDGEKNLVNNESGYVQFISPDGEVFICNTNTDLEMGPCHNQDTLIELGCSCRGDLALVHYGCALKWFVNHGSTACEICGNGAKNIRVSDFKKVLIALKDFEALRERTATGEPNPAHVHTSSGVDPDAVAAIRRQRLISHVVSEQPLSTVTEDVAAAENPATKWAVEGTGILLATGLLTVTLAWLIAPRVGKKTAKSGLHILLGGICALTVVVFFRFFVLTRIKYGPARYWAILFVFWFLVFGIWASRTHGAHTT
ncbi:RING-CH-type domain-containing protein [Citrus sinensis]|uniref:uncharacterized protein LOC102617414 isoform X2 n=1 Tax=Citrus sinensis TaxID=2711 RepID=UPI0003D6F6BF|nr:uncharacterized protein LOC102617414 isoform X2 [Citrus sinensis]KAH9668584.1 RING-CH-type domain-containing protein [Citrus sinensis]